MTPTYKVFDKTGEVTLITDSFQGAIDMWSSLPPGSMIYAVAGKKAEYLKSRESIKQWADWLMLNNYNRVERRIMNELMQQEEDGMKIVEPETGNFGYMEYLAKEDSFRDEIPALMGKVFGGDKAAPDFHGDFAAMDKCTQDQIINPKHYKDILPGYEYMQMMEHILGSEGVKAHLKGQIWKYLCRLGSKDSETQELGKIIWYSEYLKDYLEREANGQTPYNPETPRG
jgi:hypothetical protein